MMKMKKWVVVLLAFSLLWTVLCPVGATAADDSSTEGDWTYNEDGYTSTNTYYYYLQEHKNAAHPEKEIAVDLTDFRVVESDFSDAESGTALYKDLEGSKQGVNIRAIGETVIFTVDISESGLYGIELDYFPLAESNSQYLFSLLIDGEVPFTEANSCVVSRIYQNEEIATDEYGDDLRPQAYQKPQWRKQFLYDQTGVYGTLQFYFEKGQHEIALSFDGTPLLLQGLTLKQEPYLLSYQDYLSLYQQKGYKNTENILKQFQSENYYLQSSSQLWPDADNSSPLTEPFSYDHTKINYGGGMQWKQPGMWISWKVEAPADGFYYLGYKYRQGYLDGLFSSRKIMIDGEVPFAELNAVRFDYTTQWENMLLGSESGPYAIYLTEGEHVITMENVIGDLASTMSVLQTVIDNLNSLYLSIIMNTSSDPDPYRDYYLDRLLPNLPEDFTKNAELLFEEAKRLEEVVGEKGAENAYFEDVAYNLLSYAENIGDLTYKSRITNFKNDINGLSAKLTEFQEQALDLDYIMLVSPDKEDDLPKTTLNAWQWIVYQIKSFISTFRNTRVAKEENTESIRVWVNTGIDQYEIMKNMIIDDFESQYGIKVDIELSQASIVNAIVSGTGPDVMIGVTSDNVVNLALRGGLQDLSDYEGFDEILSEYVAGSEIPFMLEGRHYGMPSTHGCSVMFVRTDIFENLGLEIPQSWDDMYDVAQVLQRYNMTLGTAATFQNLLYQNGGSLYNDDLTEVTIDTDIAVAALIQHTEFYTKYGFPQAYDFANRFRTGEMPIGVADYITYTSLKYTAPEISGLWDMFPMPGTLQEDGTINRTQMDQSGTGVAMLSDAKNKDLAWEFIKWWSKAETQSRYANDLEAALGISARYATANLKTLRTLGWTNKELSILEKQFSYLKFIPIVPGSYYVSRGLNNCVRGVIDDGGNARELLTEWTIKINDEIRRKRNEFYQNN